MALPRYTPEQREKASNQIFGKKSPQEIEILLNSRSGLKAQLAYIEAALHKASMARVISPVGNFADTIINSANEKHHIFGEKAFPMTEKQIKYVAQYLFELGIKIGQEK